MSGVAGFCFARRRLARIGGTGGLLMAPATIPDHVRLGYALLHRRGGHLAPRQLRLGKVVPPSEVERLKRALESRPPVLLRAQHRPDYLKLLIAEPDNPHTGLLSDGTLAGPDWAGN